LPLNGPSKLRKEKLNIIIVIDILLLYGLKDIGTRVFSPTEEKYEISLNDFIELFAYGVLTVAVNMLLIDYIHEAIAVEAEDTVLGEEPQDLLGHHTDNAE